MMTNSNNLRFLLHPLLRGWGYALVHRQTHLSHNSFQAGTWSEAHNYHHHNEQYHCSFQAGTWSKVYLNNQCYHHYHHRNEQYQRSFSSLNLVKGSRSRPTHPLHSLLRISWAGFRFAGCWLDFTKLFLWKICFSSIFPGWLKKKHWTPLCTI